MKRKEDIKQFTPSYPVAGTGMNDKGQGDDAIEVCDCDDASTQDDDAQLFGAGMLDDDSTQPAFRVAQHDFLCKYLYQLKVNYIYLFIYITEIL